MSNYLNFDLSIEDSPEGLVTRVLSSPTGEARSEILNGLDQLDLNDRISRIEQDLYAPLTGDPDEGAAEALGSVLFDAVFSGDVRLRYVTSLERAGALGKRLRIRLRVLSEKLTNVPWEYLYNRAEGDFLVLYRNQSLTRYLETPAGPPPLHIEGPLHISVVSSNPSELDQLSAIQEEQLIVSLGKASAGRIRVQTVKPTKRALQRHLHREIVHILHFIGHGGVSETNGEGFVLFEQDDGTGVEVSATELSALLQDYANLRMVFLNCCEGARDATQSFRGVAPALVRQGLPAVVAMQFAVEDRAAVEFARTFYECLADGSTVDRSVSEARIALFVDRNAQFASPVLFMKSESEQLFDIQRQAPGTNTVNGLLAPPKKRVVALIHGPTVAADWQDEVRRALEDDFSVESTNYGPLDLLRLLVRVGVLRKKVIAKVWSHLREVRSLHPNADLSFVAHGFGTFVLAQILLRDPDLTANRIIFCGSIVRNDFPFELIAKKFEAPILNEVASKDPWPVLAESLTWGYGSAGTFGFRRPGVRDRWLEDASETGELSADYYKKIWTPFLLHGEVIDGADNPTSPSRWFRFLRLLKLKYAVMLLLVPACLLLFRGSASSSDCTPFEAPGGSVSTELPSRPCIPDRATFLMWIDENEYPPHDRPTGRWPVDRANRAISAQAVREDGTVVWAEQNLFRVADKTPFWQRRPPQNWTEIAHRDDIISGETGVLLRRQVTRDELDSTCNQQTGKRRLLEAFIPDDAPKIIVERDVPMRFRWSNFSCSETWPLRISTEAGPFFPVQGRITSARTDSWRNRKLWPFHQRRPPIVKPIALGPEGERIRVTVFKFDGAPSERQEYFNQVVGILRSLTHSLGSEVFLQASGNSEEAESQTAYLRMIDVELLDASLDQGIDERDKVWIERRPLLLLSGVFLAGDPVSVNADVHAGKFGPVNSQNPPLDLSLSFALHPSSFREIKSNYNLALLYALASDAAARRKPSYILNGILSLSDQLLSSATGTEGDVFRLKFEEFSNAAPI